MARGIVLVMLVAGCSERSAARNPIEALRAQAARHQERQEWEEEAAVLERLLDGAPRDRQALMRRARLYLDHDRSSMDQRIARYDELVARARAVGDGCDLVRLEEAGAMRRLDRHRDPALGRAAAIATWRDGLSRCRDHNLGARLNRQLAELLAGSDPGAAATHACAAVSLGNDLPAIASLCAGSQAAAPGVRALAQALTAAEPSDRLALLDQAIGADPALLGAQYARMMTLRDLGRPAEACAAVEPYLRAVRDTWEPDSDPALARSTWMEHGRALERELGCPR